MITKEQVSRAREILRWSIVDLSRWSRINRLAILAFETGDDLDERTLARMKEALENGGIEFPEGEQPRRRTSVVGVA